MKEVFTKRNVFLALVIALLGLTVIGRPEEFWSLHNIVKIVVVVLASYLLVSWQRTPRNTNQRLFANVFCIIVPLIALTFLTIMVLSPTLADTLVRESNYLENVQATCLFLASLTFLIITVRFAMQRQKLNSIVSFVLFLVFFVIGMEEISWMEWILHTQPDEYFLRYNAQNETNIHNMDTGLSEDTYYFGVFSFLVLIPFFRKQVGKFLGKVKLSALEPFLPSAWFFVPFTVMTGFMSPYSYKETTILIGFFVSLAILLYEIRRHMRKEAWRSVAWTSFLALLLLATGLFCTFSDAQLEALRSGAPKEYMENLIALGLFLYAADFYWRSFVQKTVVHRVKSR